MKNSNYFSHDCNARRDQKIVRLMMKHGAAGYGVYWMIVENLREQPGYGMATDYDAIAYDCRVDEELVRSVVEDFNLFVVQDGLFWSQSLRDRMSVMEEKVNRRSRAAKVANSVRWQSERNPNGEQLDDDLSERNPNGIRTESDFIQNKKKRKEKKINNISSDEDISISVHSAPQKKFTKPTIEDVTDYINQQGYDVDAERFVNYYESNGWKVGRNQMKDWRAAVRTWARNESNQLTNKQKDNGTNQRIDPRRIAEAAFAMADAAAERDRIFDARH